jgi:hypothetical protein
VVLDLVAEVAAGDVNIGLPSMFAAPSSWRT